MRLCTQPRSSWTRLTSSQVLACPGRYAARLHACTLKQVYMHILYRISCSHMPHAVKTKVSGWGTTPMHMGSCCALSFYAGTSCPSAGGQGTLWCHCHHRRVSVTAACPMAAIPWSCSGSCSHGCVWLLQELLVIIRLAPLVRKACCNHSLSLCASHISKHE